MIRGAALPDWVHGFCRGGRLIGCGAVTAFTIFGRWQRIGGRSVRCVGMVLAGLVRFASPPSFAGSVEAREVAAGISTLIRCPALKTLMVATDRACSETLPGSTRLGVDCGSRNSGARYDPLVRFATTARRAHVHQIWRYKSGIGAEVAAHRVTIRGPCDLHVALEGRRRVHQHILRLSNLRWS